jgi:hypothetical protein
MSNIPEFNTVWPGPLLLNKMATDNAVLWSGTSTADRVGACIARRAVPGVDFCVSRRPGTCCLYMLHDGPGRGVRIGKSSCNTTAGWAGACVFL